MKIKRVFIFLFFLVFISTGLIAEENDKIETKLRVSFGGGLTAFGLNNPSSMPLPTGYEVDNDFYDEFWSDGVLKAALGLIVKDNWQGRMSLSLAPPPGSEGYDYDVINTSNDETVGELFTTVGKSYVSVDILYHFINSVVGPYTGAGIAVGWNTPILDVEYIDDNDSSNDFSEAYSESIFDPVIITGVSYPIYGADWLDVILSFEGAWTPFNDSASISAFASFDFPSGTFK